MTQKLQDHYFHAVEKYGSAVALRQLNGRAVSYSDLLTLVHERMEWLRIKQIGPGCRVAVMMPKSIETVALFFAVLQTGAAIIPIDTGTPIERLRKILENLDPHVFVAPPAFFPSDFPSQEEFLANATGEIFAASFLPGEKHTSDLACILYTSGSTGEPKGVCITHENALGFVNWAIATFNLNAMDRLISMAPLHFDLSIFDLYAGLSVGGSVLLLDEEAVKNTRLLTETLSQQLITTIYATPSQLITLLHYGKPGRHSYPSLRQVLFAGEVFPVNALHQLMDTWPQAKFYNLYGPTETNVCTWYEIPRPYESERIDSYPIGKICSHLEGGMSPEGELLIRGSNVMPGYWQRPELDDISFAIYDEKRYYRTGDRVEMDKNRNYVYTGRLDRMIKKRGYRIEPGEVEVILQHHPDVMEAAVVPAKDEDGHTVLKAVLSVRKGANISVSIIRQYCLPLLPFYMIPERIILQGSLPKTSTGKIDYTQLAGAEQVTR